MPEELERFFGADVNCVGIAIASSLPHDEMSLNRWGFTRLIIAVNRVSEMVALHV